MAKKFLLTGLLLMVMNSVSAAGAGADLYQKNCANCHGGEGQGGMGVPLALPDFQRQVSDQFIYTTIRMGRVGRAMPAFAQLNETDVHRIIDYIRTFTHAEKPEENKAQIYGNVEHGKQLFAQNCADCHGDHGQGGEGTGVTFSRPRKFSIMAPALDNMGFLASATDTMIKATVIEGREGTPMKSFKNMKAQDINDIVSYVRSFQHKNKYSGTTQTSSNGKKKPLTLVYEAHGTVDQVVENIKRAVVGRNFRIIRVQSLEYGFAPAEKQAGNEVIVYFCNFALLNRALAIDPRIGLSLPLRVTVFEQDGVVKIAAINIKHMGHLFNNEDLDKICDQIQKVYTSILEEASL